MVDNHQKATLIAEIGCNHMGNMDIAQELIRTAILECGVTHVKFQKRNNKDLLTLEQYNVSHPNPLHSYGTTYGEHREFLEFSLDQHRVLQQYAQECGGEYSTSVWDLTSAKEIVSLNPNTIKIPSACNTNYEMLEFLCKEYFGEIQISVGMTTHQEEQKFFALFDSHHRTKDLVLFSCTSGYPVPYSDIALLEISRLRQSYASHVKAIGFSGHHIGIAVDIAAYTLGAEVIERHFTLDKTWKGTDHGASLEPQELKELQKNLNDVFLAMTYKQRELLPIEQIQRQKLKYQNKN